MENKELKLLPTHLSITSSSSNTQSISGPSSSSSSLRLQTNQFDGPSLDLQLSINVRPIRPTDNNISSSSVCDLDDVKADHASCVRTLKWQAAEQIRLASMEKAYAERMRELTRREMELAQYDFARARLIWEKAKEEVDKAERMKERATRPGQMDSMCMEITCQSCCQRFRA